MRKFLISTVAAVSALAVATPAAAQYYHAPAYGYGYGYGYNQGAVRALQTRVNRIQQDLRHLARYRMISPSEFHNRNQEARDLERRLYRDARDGRGFDGREFQRTQQRIARLEYKIQRDVHDGRRWAYRW